MRREKHSWLLNYWEQNKNSLSTLTDWLDMTVKLQWQQTNIFIINLLAKLIYDELGI